MRCSRSRYIFSYLRVWRRPSGERIAEREGDGENYLLTSFMYQAIRQGGLRLVDRQRHVGWSEAVGAFADSIGSANAECHAPVGSISEGRRGPALSPWAKV